MNRRRPLPKTDSIIRNTSKSPDSARVGLMMEVMSAYDHVDVKKSWYHLGNLMVDIVHPKNYE